MPLSTQYKSDLNDSSTPWIRSSPDDPATEHLQSLGTVKPNAAIFWSQNDMEPGRERALLDDLQARHRDFETLYSVSPLPDLDVDDIFVVTHCVTNRGHEGSPDAVVTYLNSQIMSA